MLMETSFFFGWTVKAEEFLVELAAEMGASTDYKVVCRWMCTDSILEACR